MRPLALTDRADIYLCKGDDERTRQNLDSADDLGRQVFSAHTWNLDRQVRAVRERDLETLQRDVKGACSSDEKECAGCCEPALQASRATTSRRYALATG
jgi:hypothetical protein